MKQYFWLGLSILVIFSHRKHRGSYEEAREKILKALQGFMQIKDRDTENTVERENILKNHD